MAISIKEAQRLGLLSQAKAKKLRSEMQQQSKSITQRLSVASSGVSKSNSLPLLSNFDTDPQRKIFNALQRYQQDIAMWEVEGLVSGRQYRCDIYLPESRVVVEMDGYGPHKNKEQFQADREKRNLLASTGYIVLAYYYAQVKNDIEGVVSQIIKTHNFYKPFMQHFFEAHLAMCTAELTD